MIIINESPYLLGLLKKNVYYDDNKIKFISTKGFLNDYFNLGDEIKISPKDNFLIQELENIKKEIIVLATDLDEAGDFISFEILEFLNKNENEILRLNVNFDSFLLLKELKEEDVLRVSDKKINFTNAERFWNNYLCKEEKLEFISIIYKDMFNQEIEL